MLVLALYITHLIWHVITSHENNHQAGQIELIMKRNAGFK